MTGSATPILLRIVPVEILNARRPHRLLERSFTVLARMGLLILVSGFFEPLFYLLSIRLGFAALIGEVEHAGRLLPYAEFVAPALMAASAMNGAVYESTMNIYFKMTQARLYDSVLATPLTPADVALGEIAYATFRGALYSIAFVVTMAALGMVGSWWMILAVPVCVLISFAFSATGMALTTFMRSMADFEYVPAMLLPLFLFSATFYPLASYGDWGWAVQFSPLYHGVAVVRDLNAGIVRWMHLVHVGVLVAMAMVAVTIASRRVRALLLT